MSLLIREETSIKIPYHYPCDIYFRVDSAGSETYKY